MSADERTIIIDDSRLAKIENIGRKTKTKFTKWEDFVTETIGMYLNWWINPLRASVQFQKMVPHMTDEMRNNIKEMMSGDEYAGLTETLQEDIANLADIDLPYHEDEVGDKRFVRMADKFINIDELHIDLIDRVNPQAARGAKFLQKISHLLEHHFFVVH